MTTVLTEEAADLAIEAACRTLPLPTIREVAGRLADGKRAADVSDVSRRGARRRARRSRGAKARAADRRGPLSATQTPVRVRPLGGAVGERRPLAALAGCAWIDAGGPVVLLGDSGTGKSHLLIGLGVAACEQGRRVRYVTAAALVNELAEAADERTLSRIIARYGRLELLCLGTLQRALQGFLGRRACGSSPLCRDPARRSRRPCCS
jgi:DNA replication protein DnaC